MTATIAAADVAAATPNGGTGRYRIWLTTLVGVVAVGIGLGLGWHGVDTAAAVHRIDEYRRDGFSFWDASWYGGQWTLNYSVAFGPVAATLGLTLLTLVATATGTASFQYLLERHLLPGAGSAALAAGLVFAVGNLVQTSIGQIPYLAGQALGLAALVAAARRLWLPAWVLALAASLLSPLAGLFVIVAAAAWALVVVQPLFPRVTVPARGSIRAALPAAGLAVAAGLPIVATSVLFPGEGQMPFGRTDCAWDLAIAAAVWLATSRHERVLRTGIAIYAAALVASWAVTSPLGGNVGRLGDVLALPLATLALWSRHRVVLGVVAVPLVLSSWGPAADAIAAGHSTPSTTKAFYRPLDQWLARVDPGGVKGRVEVVPTFYHWESVWVADVVPLARGWERQSDVTLNPIFYQAGGFSAAAYDRWLLDNGAAWVALPRARLDYGATREASLLRAGVPGLTPVWHDADWRVYRVDASTGLISGDATVTGLANSSITVQTGGAGTSTVRERSTADWHFGAGTGCLTTTAGGWIGLHVSHAETVTLRQSLGGPSASCT